METKDQIIPTVTVNDDGTISEQLPLPEAKVSSVDDINNKILGWRQEINALSLNIGNFQNLIDTNYQSLIDQANKRIANLLSLIDAYTPVVDQATTVLSKIQSPLGVDQQITPQ